MAELAVRPHHSSEATYSLSYRQGAKMAYWTHLTRVPKLTRDLNKQATGGLDCGDCGNMRDVSTQVIIDFIRRNPLTGKPRVFGDPYRRVEQAGLACPQCGSGNIGVITSGPLAWEDS